MRRSLERYQLCSADAIASGSKAQMMYFVEDAKADIATLAHSLSDVLCILDAVKLSAGLGTKQIARMEAARVALAKAGALDSQATNSLNPETA